MNVTSVIHKFNYGETFLYFGPKLYIHYDPELKHIHFQFFHEQNIISVTIFSSMIHHTVKYCMVFTTQLTWTSMQVWAHMDRCIRVMCVKDVNLIQKATQPPGGEGGKLEN